ncbi:hypothetical protein ACLOJK_005529 [Asimina triloba]
MNGEYKICKEAASAAASLFSPHHSRPPLPLPVSLKLGLSLPWLIVPISSLIGGEEEALVTAEEGLLTSWIQLTDLQKKMMELTAVVTSFDFAAARARCRCLVRNVKEKMKTLLIA